MGDYEQEYIEYRLFLIGEPEVGKKSFIERVLKMPCTKTLYPEEPKKKTKTNPTEQNIPKSQSLPDIKATKESKNEKDRRKKCRMRGHPARQRIQLHFSSSAFHC